MGVLSLHLVRSILIDMVRELEQHFGYLSDRYLQSLRVQIISSGDHSVMISGDSIIGSITSHRLHVCDPSCITYPWLVA